MFYPCSCPSLYGNHLGMEYGYWYQNQSLCSLGCLSHLGVGRWHPLHKATRDPNVSLKVGVSQVSIIKLQGDPSGCSLGLSDIKARVAFPYMLPILKHTFLCQKHPWNNLNGHPVDSFQYMLLTLKRNLCYDAN